MYKHKTLQKIYFFILILITISLIPIRINADENLQIYAESCILIDGDTGKILYSKNADEKMYPASTTKVMTAILALEKCHLTDIVTISHDAIFNVPYSYSNASLKEGEELSVNALLHVLLIPSANDAAFALAEHIAGSVDEFANMMNAKALELGCKNTNFVNPNGIHDEAHYSTAYDLALMGKYAMQNEAFRKIVSTITYTLPTTNKYDKDDRIFLNTNDLIRSSLSTYYEYATGAKTGYTDAAENCIIATATKNNVNLIAVVLHAKNTEEIPHARASDCKTLFEYGFNNYSKQIINTSEDIVTTIRVRGATSDTRKLDLVVNENVSMLLPNNFDTSSILKNIVLNDNIKAPITKDTVLGTVTYTSDDISVTSNLLAANDVMQSSIITIIIKIAMLIFALYIIAFILKHLGTPKKKTKKKKKKTYSKDYNNIYPSHRAGDW